MFLILLFSVLSTTSITSVISHNSYRWHPHSTSPTTTPPTPQPTVYVGRRICRRGNSDQTGPFDSCGPDLFYDQFKADRSCKSVCTKEECCTSVQWVIGERSQTCAEVCFHHGQKTCDNRILTGMTTTLAKEVFERLGVPCSRTRNEPFLGSQDISHSVCGTGRATCSTRPVHMMMGYTMFCPCRFNCPTNTLCPLDKRLKRKVHQEKEGKKRRAPRPPNLDRYLPPSMF